MAAVGKHKHSKARKGKRMAARSTTVTVGTTCKNCGKLKHSHRVCIHCGK